MRKTNAALIALAGLALVHASPCAWSQPAAELWKEPQDTVSAVFEPDKYAWRLFVALSWPADMAAKLPDSSKPFGAPGPVVWEAWRSTRHSSPDAVFKPDGSDPGPWISSGPVVASQGAKERFEPIPRKQQLFAAQQALLRRGSASAKPAPAFDEAVGAGSEVRYNQAAYDFTRANKLYNRQGLIAKLDAGATNLAYPPNSKIVKAQWRRIKDADKPRYHWTEVTAAGGAKEAWGLTALHITTKDLPNWFWATFEHIDNKRMGPIEGGMFNEGWKTRSVDRLACPQAPHDCELPPSGLGLQGTKWENYRLRGAQIDFVDSAGNPTILANAQIEQGFQTRSSCITCHALATVNREGNSLQMDMVTGVPSPGQFKDPQTGQRIFMQLDFLWSLATAADASR